uniref:Secreted protein n=1 Tax=Pyxicephalus adspersus TaxID=30357 RepID=A0AAV3B5U2_PYXAD|nr:TPA: hypothetical protein GDO54_006470 [Pyxicephalus adspersus]
MLGSPNRKGWRALCQACVFLHCLGLFTLCIAAAHNTCVSAMWCIPLHLADGCINSIHSMTPTNSRNCMGSFFHMFCYIRQPI